MSKKSKKNNENYEISRRIDKEKHEEILKIHKEIKKGIKKAIKGCNTVFDFPCGIAISYPIAVGISYSLSITAS